MLYLFENINLSIAQFKIFIKLLIHVLNIIFFFSDMYRSLPNDPNTPKNELTNIPNSFMNTMHHADNHQCRTTDNNNPPFMGSHLQNRPIFRPPTSHYQQYYNPHHYGGNPYGQFYKMHANMPGIPDLLNFGILGSVDSSDKNRQLSRHSSVESQQPDSTQQCFEGTSNSSHHSANSSNTLLLF